MALAMFPTTALLVWVGTPRLDPDDAQVLAASFGGLVPDAARSIVLAAAELGSCIEAETGFCGRAGASRRGAAEG